MGEWAYPTQAPPLQNVALLEVEHDINQLTEFFSYEHFYVIYCKFWELDADHDLMIDRRDLGRHGDGGEHGAWPVGTDADHGLTHQRWDEDSDGCGGRACVDTEGGPDD